jgi:ectoine hydroxylase-related dioxygenase (phytanoyl-CoA dioxygenase family)
MKENQIEDLKNKGYCILSEFIPEWAIDMLKEPLENSFDKHRKIQIDNGNDIITEGVALHLLLDDFLFIEFLEYLFFTLGLSDFVKENYFKSNFILNSFSGLNNLPNQLNFSSIIHRDLRFYTGQIPIMINALIMIDDFTENNGPTLLLPYSHLDECKPTDEYFHRNAIKAIGKVGSILLFNANVWHASSLNMSNKGRRALPITLTKSLIKQLLDYPRALGYDKKDTLNPDMQQLLGYHARVPANLDEWYQPFDKRFYKKNQD